MDGKRYDRFYGHFQDAYETTYKYIQDRPELLKDLENIEFFASQVFENCFPSDFDSLKKIMWFPVIEAGLELEYSVFLAKAGLYKIAYMSLRNFMELSLVYFHYLLTVKSMGNEWVKGQIPTPFKREVISVLFEDENFQRFDAEVSIKEGINRVYSELSDICHTRGQPCSHLELTRANFPQFIEDSFINYLNRTKEVINIIITCFVGVNPIILFPLPIQEKFGMNGPLSGYLEEYQVSVLRKLLMPPFLDILLKHYQNDIGVLETIQYFEALPDITKEAFQQQINDFDIMMKEMGARDMQHSELPEEK